MTPDKKKIKLENLCSTHYLSKMKIDECELIKLKRIVRNNVYPKVKFLRGKGNSNIETRSDMLKSLKTRPVTGKFMIS